MQTTSQLKIGSKYTLVSFSEFGFPYDMQFTLLGIRREPYAQYPVSYVLEFMQKGKRKARQMRFYDIKRVIIWDGFVAPETGMYAATSRNKDFSDGPVSIERSWTCFDPRYMARALNSVTQDPVVDSDGKDGYPAFAALVENIKA